MATLFQLPKAVPVSAGSSFASCRAHFYQAGTTTNITTYTTAALSVAHANPVVADANGVFAPIFIDESVNSTYRLQLRDSATVLIYDVDNIPTSPGALPLGHLYNYGTNTTPGTTDMTAAFNAALAAVANSGYALKLPGEDVLLTAQPSSIAGQITIQGEGPYQSRLIFRPTSGNQAALRASNGASRCERLVLKDFAIWSDDTTFTKIGLDLYDLSVCEIERIFIFGTGGAGPSAGACWSGANSIGIRTQGREATGLSDIEIVADRPIVIAANPNLDDTNGSLDHWCFKNLYLVANGNPCIEVTSGLGIQSITFDGYQAWVGGTSFFRINDTRAAPTIPSRDIYFHHVRTEQGTSSTAYAFDLTFTLPVTGLYINGLIGTGSRGIRLNGVTRAVLDEVVTALASGVIVLDVSGATAASVVSMRGCLWMPQNGTFTLTGLTQTVALAYRSADYAGPSDAVYAGQIVDTQITMALLKAVGVNATAVLDVSGTTGDRYQALPQAAGSGITRRSVNNAGTDFEPLVDTAETFERRYRTGVGTSAVADQIDTAGQVSVARRFFPAQDTGVIQSSCGIFAGTGAPNNANGSNGDIYFRSDGTQAGNTVIYHREGGAWVALVST